MSDDEMAETKTPNNTNHVYMRRIMRNANQIISIASRLRGYMNTEKPVLVNVYEEMVEVLNNSQVKDTVAIVNDKPQPDICGNCATELLRSLFGVLVKNALDAMPEGGRLTISYKELHALHGGAKRSVVVSVTDTGCGIPEDKLETIFQKEYTTRSEHHGLGFGLWWLKQQILRLEDGKIEVESTPGSGATFRVRLPLA